MKYSEPIVMAQIENLEQRTLEHLNSTGLLAEAERTDTAFHIMYDYLKAVPEIVTAFEGFKVLGAAAYIMYTHNPGHPHKDQTQVQARVNVPILNCENTVTEFWQYDTVNEPEVIYQANGLPYQSFDSVPLTLAHSVTIDQPTVIRVREVHSVRMLSELRPRITMTLLLDPDPVILLEN